MQQKKKNNQKNIHQALYDWVQHEISETLNHQSLYDSFFNTKNRVFMKHTNSKLQIRRKIVSLILPPTPPPTNSINNILAQHTPPWPCFTKYLKSAFNKKENMKKKTQLTKKFTNATQIRNVLTLHKNYMIKKLIKIHNLQKNW